MKKNSKYLMLSTLLAVLLLARGKEEEAMKVTNLIGKYEDISDENMLEAQESKLAIQQKAHFINQEQEYTKKLEPSKFIKIPSIIANENVNIRKSPTIEGELAGKLVEGHTLELLEELNNGWYKVLYYDEVRYVNSDYVSKTTTYQVKGDIQKLCYVPEGVEGVEITVPSEVSSSGLEEQVTVPALEFFEVYEEDKENYLVQTNDYIGYVKKTSLEELAGTIAVVDISDQEFKFYLDNKIVIETPVVTGNPNKKGCATDVGLFEIYKFKENDYLRGPGYESYVDVMMFYNQGEGFHDAERHYCDNGEQDNHGWRDEYQFGGDTYLVNGSHGCVNMPNDEAVMLYRYVEEGTPVLVKK